jgi:hypothetical protein
MYRKLFTIYIAIPEDKTYSHTAYSRRRLAHDWPRATVTAC